ncbi:hypothetical protein BJ878DRAFT_488953 [Calycina marina]|uniref:Uncharacterized protein n=1 Tax=Calycina marina TaxID=1763456 RepID=A0A9P7ZAD1_9HELO|nr:hypothetical protein BJ878DRAFT_488953 [Calycina marina]
MSVYRILLSNLLYLPSQLFHPRSGRDCTTWTSTACVNVQQARGAKVQRAVVIQYYHASQWPVMRRKARRVPVVVMRRSSLQRSFHRYADQHC